MQKSFAQMRDLVNSKATLARDILTKCGIQLESGATGATAGENMVQGWSARNGALYLTIVISIERDGESPGSHPELDITLIDERIGLAGFSLGVESGKWFFIKAVDLLDDRQSDKLFNLFEPRRGHVIGDEELKELLPKLAQAFLKDL